MAISTGTRLGVYEIVAPLGAGGMGEVFRARDTRLGRDVAIKLLPAELAGDRERLTRFEKEARAASSLNHPNIVTIYEIGDAGGMPYIAMELVDGKTLRQMLVPGPLPVRKLLEVAAQAADGLAKAHGAGIVHRDLKPENLMVSQDGFVKLLDFGLAKLSATNSGELRAASTLLETEPGAVMGTAAYMSPEQASGGALDFRSDQFALGAMLYEMATGRRPFQAATAAQTMAAIIQDEPEPIAQLNPKVPAPLRWVIERCMAKERERRYASTTDLARDLATLRDRLSEASTAPGLIAPPQPARRRWRAAALAAALLVATAAGAWVSLRVGSKPLPTFKRLTFRRGSLPSARFSPDERTIVYSASWGGAPFDVFTVREDSPESRSLGLPDARVAAVSSTGDALIVQNRTLSQVPLGGGAPRALQQRVSNADWSDDGGKTAVLRAWRSIEMPPGKEIYAAPGAQRITNLRLSKDGRQAAFIQTGDQFTPGNVLVVIDASGNVLLRSRKWFWAFGLAWSARGDEIWYTGSDGNGAFELLATDLSGRERRVAVMPGQVALLDISPDGRLLLTRTAQSIGFTGLFPGAREERDLSWFDQSVVSDLSADGRTILFTESGEAAGASPRIYLRSTEGTPAVRIGDGVASALSPDGKWVATLPEEQKIRLLPTGAGDVRSLSYAPIAQAEKPGWHPDGRRIAFSGKEDGHGWRCYTLDIESGATTPITPEGIAGLGVHAEPQFSPDGRRLVARLRDQSQQRAPRVTGIFDLQSGTFSALDWLEDESGEVYWTADGRGLLWHRHAGRTTEIVRTDLATGATEVLHRLAYSDLSGIDGELEPEGITPDGRWYVYNYSRTQDDLYVVSGLK